MGIVFLLCLFSILFVLVFFYVRSVDYMQNNHPDYDGNDFFCEDEEDIKLQ
jgi:hypothetical protein